MGEEKRITCLDMRIAVAATICVLTAVLLNALHLHFTYGEMKLEIIQKMTSAIACLLCCQDNFTISKKTGINRLIITFVGGIVGIAVILLDGLFHNQWILAMLIFAGLLLTLMLCKCAGVPYINARIGGITFILVSCTLAGRARIWYAIFRFISTFYGVLIVLLVTWVWEHLKGGKANEV